ncbi:ABC transporter substrate-binding protein [Ruminococcaceae bacterium OttesenSCG-928-L11]|nr:ABC transporter substrate-binding protein [Ruminococcaceae bacterium OttesenSCG-928-L11]
MIGTITYKVLSVLAAALLTVLSLRSCDDLAREVPATAAVEDVALPAEAPVVSILQGRGEISQQLQVAADQYLAANPGAVFHVQTIQSRSDYGAVLRSRLLAGERVDIFQISGAGERQELAPYLSDLSDLEWLSGALDGSLNAVTDGGAIYGIPYSLEGAGLIINRRIFESAGIYLSGIATLEALEEAFAQLQDAIAAGELAEAFPRLEAVTEFAAHDVDYLAALVSGLLLTDSFATAADTRTAMYLELPMEENAYGLIRLLALYSSCTSWDQLTRVSQVRQLEEGLGTERIACVYQSTEVYRALIAANPELETRLELLPVPLGTEENRQVLYTETPAYWAVHNGSDDTAAQEAKKFLTWLYCSDSGSTLYASRFQAVSPFRATAKDTGLPLHSHMLRQIEAGNSQLWHSNELPVGWGVDVFAAGLQGVLAKESTWDAFVADCRDQWHRERLLESSTE